MGVSRTAVEPGRSVRSGRSLKSSPDSEPSRRPRAGLEVLIEAKLHPPGLRSEWVERSGLIRCLSDTAAKLTLVAAPAGFGKSTLVAQWRASSIESRPFAWVSLDRGDNDPVRLWWHVITALRRACPGLGGEALRLLRAGEPDLAGTVLPVLVNELAALAVPVVLVLDDYHLIKERGCQEQIEFLLRHLLPSVRLVLITRADPPLPLARLRAAGDMAEVRARELRFTPADVAALVSAAAGVNLSEADAAELAEGAEGWAAGIYLAALSLRESPSPGAVIRQLTGNSRFIADFLAEEIVNRQPPEIRRFLQRTSILDQFTAPLCDAVAGTSTAAEVIQDLERANLFVVPLDDHRLWYRYHHLFAQMLRSQLARAEPDLVPALHERASAWHRERGSAEAAIEHALAAGDFRGAVDLIACYWSPFVSAGRAATVREWIRSLGDDRVGADPIAAHCAAWVAALCGDRGSARRWLQAIEAGQLEGPLPDGMPSLKFSAALLHGTFGFDGVKVMCESAARAVEMESDPMSPWQAQAHAVFGFSLYLSGKPEAAAALDKAVAGEVSRPLTRMLALAVAALVAADDGRLAQAHEYASLARQIADGNDLSKTPQATVVKIASGAIHAGHGELEEARTEFEHALRSRRRWLGITPWPTADLLLRLGMVLLDLGDRPVAAELLAEARDTLNSLPDGAEWLQARLTLLEDRLASPSGRPPLAEPLTRREEAVLRLLRGTLSRREIGTELHLSENTIKTHTRAIYRKLGASTRDDTIKRARELGILP